MIYMLKTLWINCEWYKKSEPVFLGRDRKPFNTVCNNYSFTTTKDLMPRAFAPQQELLLFTQPCPTFATPWTAAPQASLFFTISRSLLKLMSIDLVMPTNHLILCHPLLVLPSIFPSIRIFSNELALHIKWPKYWSFSFSISPSNEYSGLISFRIDWFDLLAVQGTLLKGSKKLIKIRKWPPEINPL